jgi:excisionase family DNA binding protein
MANPNDATPIRRARPHTTQPEGEPRELLRVEDAAARLSIGRTYMFALIRDGVVESVKLGRLRRVPVDALTDYIAHLAATQHAAA